MFFWCGCGERKQQSMRLQSETPPPAPPSQKIAEKSPKDIVSSDRPKLESRPSLSEFSEKGDDEDEDSSDANSSDIFEDLPIKKKATLLSSFIFPTDTSKKEQSPSHRKLRYRSSESYGAFGF
mmetsp:Transcript_18010/g.23487  ORF Transcript_18010/g.23487 Transcript_18010/m.23487 type:complete len:123 (+) Transcript_18010:86-454(+)